MLGLYGFLAVQGLLNWIGMPRPRPLRRAVSEQDPAEAIAILIPARNEADHLKRLIPALLESAEGGAKVYVFDDGSTDGTAEVAAQAGAIVLHGGADAPEGWTGKTHACHRLAMAAAEDAGVAWWLFLDADVRPGKDFVPALRGWIAARGSRAPLMTAFPQMLPGGGIEPLFLAWVGWILLAFNPFWIVRLTGKGHTRFTNGQLQLWRAEVYTKLWPHEQVRAQVLEDVHIGRLMAREKLPVDVVNLSAHFAVKMYHTWREALDGMSKNAHEIAGNTLGTWGIALGLLLCGWLWVLAGWPALALFVVSGLLIGGMLRAPLWPALAMPLIPTFGALALIRSWWWHRTGRVVWKGRVYGKRLKGEE